jgi:hypothetical protein
MDINYIRLCKIKKEIKDLVEEAGYIIKTTYPDQYSVSMSFWIPQIITALEEDKKWLSRGDHSMQNTINKIKQI